MPGQPSRRVIHVVTNNESASQILFPLGRGPGASYSRVMGRCYPKVGVRGMLRLIVSNNEQEAITSSLSSGDRVAVAVDPLQTSSVTRCCKGGAALSDPDIHQRTYNFIRERKTNVPVIFK
jgi:hypothetical protein